MPRPWPEHGVSTYTKKHGWFSLYSVSSFQKSLLTFCWLLAFFWYPEGISSVWWELFVFLFLGPYRRQFWHHVQPPIRASPPVLSMWLQTVNFIVETSKCVGLAAQEKLVFLHQIRAACLLWLVKGATQLRTSRKECNKLHLTAAQYFFSIGRSQSLVQVVCY